MRELYASVVDRRHFCTKDISSRCWFFSIVVVLLSFPYRSHLILIKKYFESAQRVLKAFNSHCCGLCRFFFAYSVIPMWVVLDLSRIAQKERIKKRKQKRMLFRLVYSSQSSSFNYERWTVTISLSRNPIDALSPLSIRN